MSKELHIWLTKEYPEDKIITMFVEIREALDRGDDEVHTTQTHSREDGDIELVKQFQAQVELHAKLLVDNAETN